MKNKHCKFWLTVGSGVTMVMLFVFMIAMSIVVEFNFKKEYCLLLIPILLYTVAQSVINYCEMTDE
jgi:hypothetical protein